MDSAENYGAFEEQGQRTDGTIEPLLPMDVLDPGLVRRKQWRFVNLVCFAMNAYLTNLFQENIYHYSRLRISGETYDASRIKISLEDIDYITAIINCMRVPCLDLCHPAKWPRPQF